MCAVRPNANQALPWLSALCCLGVCVLPLCLCYLFPSLFSNPALPHLPLFLSLSSLTHQSTNNAPPSSWWSALLWLVASLLGWLCVMMDQFTQVWPSCWQVSFLWEVFHRDPGGECYPGWRPFTAPDVSTILSFFSGLTLVFCLLPMIKREAPPPCWCIFSYSTIPTFILWNAAL